jgi:hypothetical protein
LAEAAVDEADGAVVMVTGEVVGPVLIVVSGVEVDNGTLSNPVTANVTCTIFLVSPSKVSVCGTR